VLADMSWSKHYQEAIGRHNRYIRTEDKKAGAWYTIDMGEDRAYCPNYCKCACVCMCVCVCVIHVWSCGSCGGGGGLGVWSMVVCMCVCCVL
jgi:hypothetical protein